MALPRKSFCVSTLLSLIVVPAIYVLIDRFLRWFSRMFSAAG